MLKKTFAALALGALIALPAAATGLSAKQTVERVVKTTTEDGTVEVSFEPAETMVPGDELVYTISYVNDGSEAAENIVLTMPVPNEVSFIENSAAAENATIAFSADGGETFSARGDLQITLDGATREALSSEITHVRWTFSQPVEAGNGGELFYKARLK